MSNEDFWDRIPPSKMQREEYACDEDWIRDFLLRMQVGHVATLWESQPFITPVLYWYDPGAREVYFHTNIVGRLRANSLRNERVCFEVSRTGKLLPSNVALEFSIQYESVVLFGQIRLLDDDRDKRRVLYGLIDKYFPEMTPGQHYRPITDMELKRTSVFAIAIESWSGKRNWNDQADQSPDWPPLSDIHKD
jgi:nitroimidazol reductase NimA-like FMN-containing flavoprotein (pyridoxamine 5'-phosphate oxidase superfamily)